MKDTHMYVGHSFLYIHILLLIYKNACGTIVFEVISLIQLRAFYKEKEKMQFDVSREKVVEII